MNSCLAPAQNFESADGVNSEDLAKFNRANAGINDPAIVPGHNPYNLIPTASFGGVPDAPSFTFDGRFPIRGCGTCLLHHGQYQQGLAKPYPEGRLIRRAM